MLVVMHTFWALAVEAEERNLLCQEVQAASHLPSTPLPAVSSHYPTIVVLLLSEIIQKNLPKLNYPLTIWRKVIRGHTTDNNASVILLLNFLTTTLKYRTWNLRRKYKELLEAGK